METIIYSKDTCTYCTQAKDLLDKHDIPWRQVIMSSVEELQTQFAQFGKKPRSFPQIFMGGKHIGGFVNLRDKLEEPLLIANPSRFTVFPIQYPDIWTMYKKALASFWTVEEVDFSKDRADLETLKPQEYEFIKNILAFFAASDGIVMENLVENFCAEVQIPEARQFYVSQAMIEGVHNEMYSLLIDSYVKDTKEKNKLFNAVLTMPVIKLKADWALKWLDTSRPFGERLVAFVCIEGILFSASFCSIFYLKKRNLLPALSVSNDFISRDEGLHQQFGELLFSYLKYKPSRDVIEAIVREAVDVEQTFTREAIKVALIGMNEKMMCTYVEYVADRILENLGCPPMYNAECPFDFMQQYGLDGKVSFFEQRNTEYSKAGVMATREDMQFGMTDDF